MHRAARFSRRFTLAAWLMALATLGIWIATGAHRGWSRTSVTEMQLDEVTGIQFPVTRDAFVAGIDFLAIGIALSLLLGTAALLARRRAA